MDEVTNQDINYMSDLIESLQYEVKKAVTEKCVSVPYMKEKLEKLDKVLCEIRRREI